MRFADIRAGVVVNIVEAPEGTDPLAIKLLIPDTDEVVSVSDSTGPAYIGGSYVGGKFRPPAPHDSWVWDDNVGGWVAPTPYPQDGLLYSWDENIMAWAELVIEDAPEGPVEG